MLPRSRRRARAYQRACAARAPARRPAAQEAPHSGTAWPAGAPRRHRQPVPRRPPVGPWVGLQTITTTATTSTGSVPPPPCALTGAACCLCHVHCLSSGSQLQAGRSQGAPRGVRPGVLGLGRRPGHANGSLERGLRQAVEAPGMWPLHEVDMEEAPYCRLWGRQGPLLHLGTTPCFYRMAHTISSGWCARRAVANASLASSRA